MTNPFKSPESKANAEGASTSEPSRVALSKRRGVFYGVLAIGLTLASLALIVIFGLTLALTERRNGYPGDDRSFGVMCFIFATWCCGVLSSIVAASAAIYGTLRELRCRDNAIAAGTVLLGFALAVPWCTWLLWGTVDVLLAQ